MNNLSMNEMKTKYTREKRRKILCPFWHYAHKTYLPLQIIYNLIFIVNLPYWKQKMKFSLYVKQILRICIPYVVFGEIITSFLQSPLNIFLLKSPNIYHLDKVFFISHDTIISKNKKEFDKFTRGCKYISLNDLENFHKKMVKKAGFETSYPPIRKNYAFGNFSLNEKITLLPVLCNANAKTHVMYVKNLKNIIWAKDNVDLQKLKRPQNNVKKL